MMLAVVGRVRPGRCNLASIQRLLVSENKLPSIPLTRAYSPTTSGPDEGVASTAADNTAEDKQAERLRRKRIAQDFNRRRAAYKREVTRLRREYAEEIAAERAAFQKQKDAQEKEQRRERLERTRQKNILKGQNALRQEEVRLEQQRVFEEHLAQVQLKRDARKERFRVARQMYIDELEKEAHLWLSTPEEIEAAFSVEAEQFLWARPQGVLGSKRPSSDCHFWSQETHTYKMDKTYLSQRQYLFNFWKEDWFQQSSISDLYWTPEKIAEAEKTEDRAHFLSDLAVTGQRRLLKRQGESIEELPPAIQKGGEVKDAGKPLNLNFLKNKQALEDAGAEALLEDPTKFFTFDERALSEKQREMRSINSTTGKYSGPTLGAPTGYRRLGEKKFPIFLGKLPKSYKGRGTQREKKRREREQSLFAAAQTKQQKDVESVEYIIENRAMDKFPDAHYDRVEDPEAKEWERTIDKSTPEGKKMLELQPALRMTQEDYDWATEQMDQLQDQYEEYYRSEFDGFKSSLESELAFDRKETGQTDVNIDELDPKDATELAIERKVLAMSVDELMALSDLDEAYEAAGFKVDAQELAKHAAQIPSLTSEQIQWILERDRERDPKDDAWQRAL